MRIPLPPAVADAIDVTLDLRAAGSGAPGGGSGLADDAPLFVTPTGAPIYEVFVFRLIRRLARAADIAAADRLSPHSLRHTAITEHLEATDGNLRAVQDFAGHADPRTTRRYDRARHQLDGHGAYVLAARFTVPDDPTSPT